MKIPIALVGLGAVADRIHLPACKSLNDLEIVAACDQDPGTRDRMAAKFGIPKVFATDEEMLRAVKPEILIVGTPPRTHFSICSRGLEAGAHVLCEKPFMSTVDEADRIIELASARGRLLRVNNQYRFMTMYRDTKERLARGEFGRVFYIQAWQQMFHPPSVESNWRNSMAEYVLYEFGTHALDLITHFFEALPVSVNFHTPKVRPEFPTDVLVCGTLRFDEERIATLSFNRVSHAPERYLEMRLDCEKASIRISLGGVAKISVEWSRSAGRPVLKGGMARGGQAREEKDGRSRVLSTASQSEFAIATAEHLKHFITEMRTSPPSLDAARHGRQLLRTVFAGYESARSGETVWLNRSAQGTTT